MADLIATYVDWLVNRRGLAVSSVYGYERKLRQFERFVAPTPLGEIDEALVVRFLERGHNKATTQERDLIILRGFWRYWERKHMLPACPFEDVVTPKKAKLLPHPIRDELWVRWYEADHADPDVMGVLGCGFFLGLRRADIVGLRAEQITQGLHIEGLRRKGDREDALDVIGLTEVVAKKLPHLAPDKGERWLEWFASRMKRGGLLFDWHLVSRRDQGRLYAMADATNDPQWMYRRIDRWARHAHLPHFRPHDLRHAFVTNLLRAGLPIHVVSVLAAHENISTTMLYAKIGNADLRNFLAEADTTEPASRLERRM